MSKLRSVFLIAALACAVTPAESAHKALPKLVVAPDDCSIGTVPDVHAYGRIAGKRFELAGASLSQSGAMAGGAAYDNYLLTLEAPDAAGATMVIVVTASVPQGVPLDGKTFRRVASLDATQQPEAGAGQPQIPDFGIEYSAGQVDVDSLSGVAAIRLEFGTRAGGKLPAKIYLCQPNGAGNVFAGTFSVDVGSP
jgi:hypothetical protein